MQLVDGNLHWCLREHLCAHVVKNERCFFNGLATAPEFKVSGFVFLFLLLLEE